MKITMKEKYIKLSGSYVYRGKANRLVEGTHPLS